MASHHNMDHSYLFQWCKFDLIYFDIFDSFFYFNGYKIKNKLNLITINFLFKKTKFITKIKNLPYQVKYRGKSSTGKK